MLEAISFGGSIVRRCLTEAFEDTNGSHDAEVHRLSTPFGSQPIAPIGEIDELRWQQFDEVRDTESDHRGKNANADQHAEKADFVCQPFATPRALKCEAITSGNCAYRDEK